MKTGVILLNNLGKWEQCLLLKQNQNTANYIPHTVPYSLGNLLDYLERYKTVYVKHNSSGQGRAIFKVFKNKEDQYCYSGFTIHGIPVNNCVSSLEDFHILLHPFTMLGRTSGTYIIQEGVESVTKWGQPISFRVHVQFLDGEWLIGGIYGKVGTIETNENGIVNSYRGAQIKTVDEILTLYLAMNELEKSGFVKSLEEISLSTAEVISSHFPRRDYGLDFGVKKDYLPVLFEVNTSPGIGGFAKIDNKQMWKRIISIRKMQNEG